MDLATHAVYIRFVYGMISVCTAMACALIRPCTRRRPPGGDGRACSGPPGVCPSARSRTNPGPPRYWPGHRPGRCPPTRTRAPMRRVRSFAALVLAAAVPAWAGPDRVLVIHSYERGHVCGQPQHDGVLEGLREAGLEPGKDVEVSAFYMDTKRRHTTPEAIRRRALEARERLRQVRPAVVVTLDDNAFRTVALELVDTPVPVVFSGVNTPLSRYNRTRRFFESWERPPATTSRGCTR